MLHNTASAVLCSRMRSNLNVVSKMLADDVQNSFVEMAKRNRVFVLGAGFSVAAGVPLTNELLRTAMNLFSAECPGIDSRVETYAMEAIGQRTESLDISKLNFSELCTFLEFVELREYGGGERWSENGSREKLALRFYLAKAIVASTPRPKDVPELYRAFADQLQPRDIVISFNWDGLLEAALESVGKPYTYERANEGAIVIAKLHGSVNWRLHEPRRLDRSPPMLRWRQLDFGGDPTKPSMYCAPELLNARAWTHIQPLSEVDPYLVLPGYGKAFDVRANAPLWYKPEFAFAFTHDVYVIGLSLAHDDFFVRSFFLSNLPYLNDFTDVPDRKVVIINPSDDVYRDYDFVLKTGSAEVWKEKFDIAHIDRIKRRTASA